MKDKIIYIGIFDFMGFKKEIRIQEPTYGESLQWAKLGYSYEEAQTVYTCKDCGIQFIHYYHVEPNIYKAFEESGLPKECIKRKPK